MTEFNVRYHLALGKENDTTLDRILEVEDLEAALAAVPAELRAETIQFSHHRTIAVLRSARVAYAEVNEGNSYAKRPLRIASDPLVPIQSEIDG